MTQTIERKLIEKGVSKEYLEGIYKKASITRAILKIIAKIPTKKDYNIPHLKKIREVLRDISNEEWKSEKNYAEVNLAAAMFITYKSKKEIFGDYASLDNIYEETKKIFQTQIKK